MDIIGNFLNDLGNIASSSVQNAADSDKETGIEKKDLAIALARDAYDVLDKALDLPVFVDMAIKNVVIPILIDLAYHGLKENGIL